MKAVGQRSHFRGDADARCLRSWYLSGLWLQQRVLDGQEFAEAVFGAVLSAGPCGGRSGSRSVRGRPDLVAEAADSDRRVRWQFRSGSGSRLARHRLSAAVAAGPAMMRQVCTSSDRDGSCLGRGSYSGGLDGREGSPAAPPAPAPHYCPEAARRCGSGGEGNALWERGGRTTPGQH